MSVQFGNWNLDGKPSPASYIEKVKATLAPYGPDSNESYVRNGLTMLFGAFRTTTESHREVQPHISNSGTVITWDGRLDNRPDLILEMRNAVSDDSTDVSIASAAYEKWGTNCFGRLIGDWAISVANPNGHSLLLATDPIGTRRLYYSVHHNQITWCTILEPLLFLADRSFSLCEEYIAGWLSTFPQAHLTPYATINAVPPSSTVLFRSGTHSVARYWDFDPNYRIRHRTDAEYEEHFRTVFATAVQRRLRSDRPVLAELSGGMDSSSIVCVADTIPSRHPGVTPRLDTVSWYDDSYDHLEPDWNEFPYLTKVEERRGRAGYHINIRELTTDAAIARESINSQFENDALAVTPFAHNHVSQLVRHYLAFVGSQEYRVTLSGVGGDDVMGGGVPTPIPEFQNLLAGARLFKLIRQLNAWSAKMRKSRLSLMWEAIQHFLVKSPPNDCAPPPRAGWLDSEFANRNSAALRGYPCRVKLFGSLPSFQDSINTLNVVRRFVAHCVRLSKPVRELRFPYLDRTLLEFMYAIPREQIVRVGQRRSLMKRALVGTVPSEILNRRRKAFMPPHGTKGFLEEWLGVIDKDQHLISSSMGVVNANRLLDAIQKASRNEKVFSGSLARTMQFESWLRHLTNRGFLSPSAVKGDNAGLRS
jgi:asparagine synthase (glutamine-hydrolysing)